MTRLEDQYRRNGNGKEIEERQGPHGQAMALSGENGARQCQHRRDWTGIIEVFGRGCIDNAYDNE